jgi:glycerol-3-phosphate dehydrogenase (NAD(P)+)
MSAFEHIAVVGAGAFGTALANVAANAGRKVTLCVRSEAEAEKLRGKRESARLPGVKIDAAITIASTDGAKLDCDAVLLAVPSQASREALKTIAPKLREKTPVIACAKGIEHGTRRFMTDIIAEIAPTATPAILSGPCFATDMGRGLPVAVTLAAHDEAIARALSLALGTASFRPYYSNDVRGAEIGGAAKNVLAIAAGIVAGKGLGLSAAAALTTRGFAELVRFGRALGAKPDTMMGLSGLGDLILTCSSPQSRNFSFGVNLGKGLAPKDIHATTGLAEGVFTAPVLLEMAQARGVDMPISSAVAAVLANAITVDEAIDSLLTRPFKAE